MYTNLGSALLDLNKKFEAVEMYNTALQLDNENADAAFNLAMVHHDEGEERRAIELYKLCLRSAPDRIDAWMNLASCLHAIGDIDKSIFAYSKALAYDNALETQENSTAADAISSGSEGCGSIISVRGKVHEYLGRAILRKRDNEKAASSSSELVGREAALQAMTDDALGHLEAAVRLDPDNADVAKHMIASNSNSPQLQIDAVASTEYVRKLFDDYSSDFESSLAGLDYKVPALMVKELLSHDQSGNGKWGMVVDLGCGTGLLGSLLRDALLAIGTENRPSTLSVDGDDNDAVTVVAGVDLSLKMLEVAEKKGVYDYLAEGDVVEFVNALAAGHESDNNNMNRLRLVSPAAGSASGSSTDTKTMTKTMSILHSLQDSRVLYAAADVLVYIGDLTALFAALGEAMMQGDTFIFTVENADENAQRSHASKENGWILQVSGRYAHHVQYIRRLAKKNGMDLVHAKRIVPRKELNEDIKGYMCILQAASE